MAMKSLVLYLAVSCAAATSQTCDGNGPCTLENIGIPSKLNNFIGGEFVAPADGAYVNVVSPATGEVIAECASSTATDVERAIAGAKTAQDIWGSYPVQRRAAIVKALADKLADKAERMATAESIDMGKVLESSAGDDLKRQIRNLNYHAEMATHAPGMSSVVETDESYEKRPGESSSKSYVNYVTRYPIGVVAVIGHWSRPLHQLVWRLAPALVAGNGVVLKPPSVTPITAYLLAEALAELEDLPKGIVSIVHGSGDAVGSALAEHRAIGAIAMVGGVEAAASIQGVAAGARSMKKLKFDLGNNHAMVVAPDADLDALMPVAMTAAFGCDAGQRAHSLGRLIVHKDIAAEVTKRLVAGARALTLGHPLSGDASGSVDMGPIVSKKQLSLLQTGIEELVEAGGEILLGSARDTSAPTGLENGNWMAPVIVGNFTYAREQGDCTRGCGAHDGGDYDYDQGGAWAKEHQGPVVKIIVVDSLDDLAHAANAGPFGLSASVWAKDISTAHSLAHAIDAGYIWVNNWLARDLAMPFGGWKESGNGQRSGGVFDVDFFTYTKTTCLEIAGRHAITGKVFA